ncbi:MAG: hypothetical protein K2H04_08305 [Bacteroidaceae bacterium]|nr:hypothetical protein [Bacteroidaceae bacterium]
MLFDDEFPCDCLATACSRGDEDSRGKACRADCLRVACRTQDRALRGDEADSGCGIRTATHGDLLRLRQIHEREVVFSPDIFNARRGFGAEEDVRTARVRNRPAPAVILVHHRSLAERQPAVVSEEHRLHDAFARASGEVQPVGFIGPPVKGEQHQRA